MLACPMISWSIFGGYPAWIISEAVTKLPLLFAEQSKWQALARAMGLILDPAGSEGS